MRFKILFITTLLWSSFTFSQTKLGTVNSEYIASLMPEREIVVKKTKEYSAKLDTAFNAKMQDYNTKIELFKIIEKGVTDSIKAKKYNELVYLEQELQKYKQNGNQLIQLKQNELMRPLYTKLSATIQEIAKANGYTQILTTTGNEFAYIDDQFDITQLVMDKLGLKAPTEEK